MDAMSDVAASLPPQLWQPKEYPLRLFLLASTSLTPLVSFEGNHG
jgi:hypothetical protein